MNITNYHIHNVLRAYGKQLSQSKRRLQHKRGDALLRRTERINLSVQARRKAIIDRVTSDIINRIINDGPLYEMEKEAFGQLEEEYGDSLSVNNENSELVFKVIDKEKGEVTKTLSIEDSNFLKDRLEEITKSKVENQMIT